MKRKKQQTELISFRATVVEVEAYKSVVEGKVLYHAVLDSMPPDPPRQAQFFGLSENIFELGCVHFVTFSRPVARSKRKAVKPNKKAEEIKELERMVKEIN
jgi:hypothetical protein